MEVFEDSVGRLDPLDRRMPSAVTRLRDPLVEGFVSSVNEANQAIKHDGYVK